MGIAIALLSLVIIGLILVNASCRKNVYLTRTKMNYQLTRQKKEHDAQIQYLKDELLLKNSFIDELKKHQVYNRKCPHCYRFLKKGYAGEYCYHCNKQLIS